MKKYMQLIESITCVLGYEKDDVKAKYFDDIYKIAHVANGTCKNTHSDRIKDVDKIMDEFINL